MQQGALYYEYTVAKQNTTSNMIHHREASKSEHALPVQYFVMAMDNHPWSFPLFHHSFITCSDDYRIRFFYYKGQWHTHSHHLHIIVNHVLNNLVIAVRTLINHSDLYNLVILKLLLIHNQSCQVEWSWLLEITEHQDRSQSSTPGGGGRGLGYLIHAPIQNDVTLIRHL